MQNYQPYFDSEGWVIYPTEEEAEYPPGMVEAYVKGGAPTFRKHQPVAR